MASRPTRRRASSLLQAAEASEEEFFSTQGRSSLGQPVRKASLANIAAQGGSIVTYPWGLRSISLSCELSACALM